jgi:hypothetical protein
MSLMTIVQQNPAVVKALCGAEVRERPCASNLDAMLRRKHFKFLAQAAGAGGEEIID